MPIFLWFAHQPSPHRIHANVLPMSLKILFITNPMIRKARLPDGHLRFQLEREPSLDELNGLLQRNFMTRRDQCMEVVRHHDEFVQQIFSLSSITQKSFDKQVGRCVSLKECSPLCGDGGDEEGAIHEGNVALKEEKRCAGSHGEIVRFREKSFRRKNRA
jgi:hypothetical protein